VAATVFATAGDRQAMRALYSAKPRAAIGDQVPDGWRPLDQETTPTERRPTDGSVRAPQAVTSDPANNG
jgi:hypothetical protein